MSRPRYPVYNNPCGWNAMLAPRTPKPALEGRHKVKYAIIGAGYVGLGAARRLAQLDPGAEIMVLEASTVGEGSSARNSGFTSAYAIPRGLSAASAEKSRNLSRFHGEGFAWVCELIEQFNIDCGITRSGSIRCGATERGASDVLDAYEVMKQSSIPHTFLDKAALAEHIGTDYYRCGLHVEDTYLLQPAALIRGLADSLPSEVRLCENSPVLGIRKANGWELTLDGAHVTADHLILAANGFAKQFGYLKERMVTIFTYAAISEALKPDEAAQLGAAEVWGILPTHRLGSTLRRVGNDRVMVRSLYSYEREMHPEKVERELTRRLHNRWPGLSHIRNEYIWGGTTALTLNGSPYWGELDDKLYVSAGCNGSGIAKGTVLGKRLAELICRTGDDEDVRRTFGVANRIAPEPLRTIGFNVISALEQRKAGREM